MRRSYVPKRHEFCSLAKYHTCEHYYEVPDYAVNVSPVEPRCLAEREVMWDDGLFVPSFVRHIYVPIERREP